jgi:DNA processing protein
VTPDHTHDPPTGAEDPIITTRHRLWLKLFLAPGVGGVTCARLLSTFGTVEAIFAAEAADFKASKVSAAVHAAIHDEGLAGQADRLEETLCAWPDARILTPACTDYPGRLLRASAFPAALFVRGTLANQLVAVAVVGSRRPSLERAALTREWCQSLAEGGVCIVSGLAEGIDRAAHEGALSGSGHTVAVLGTGLDRTYPSHHAALLERILDTGGAVLSQFAPYAPTHPGFFPARNATIAGLADAVVIMQAGPQSGALSTARHAKDYQRPVLAVPSHPGDPDNAGCLKLLKSAAHAISTPEDLAYLVKTKVRGRRALPDPTLTASERRVFDELGFEGKSVDELTRRLGEPAPSLLDLLLRLELAGVISRQPGPRYVRIR